MVKSINFEIERNESGKKGAVVPISIDAIVKNSISKS